MIFPAKNAIDEEILVGTYTSIFKMKIFSKFDLIKIPQVQQLAMRARTIKGVRIRWWELIVNKYLLLNSINK